MVKTDSRGEEDWPAAWTTGPFGEHYTVNAHAQIGCYTDIRVHTNASTINIIPTDFLVIRNVCFTC